MTRFLLCLPLLLGVPAAAAAQEISGDWTGTLSSAPYQLNVVVHLSGDAASGYRGTFDSPDQNVHGLELGSVTLQDGTLAFTVPSVGGSFQGVLHENGESVAGEWSQGGNSLPLELGRRPAGQTDAQRIPRPGEMDGAWRGTVNLQGQPLEMIFRITTYEDGLGGTLDVPAQNGRGLPISEITRDGSRFRLEMRQVGGTFEGVLGEDGSSLSGVWRQPGFESPLVLRRTDD